MNRTTTEMPLQQIAAIKQSLKALYETLEGDNNHRANCHMDIALNHLRLAEYEVEQVGR